MEKMRSKVLAIIYIVILCNFPAIVFAGDLNPPGPPESTMRSLDEISPSWYKILPVSERFKTVMNGAAVLDKETGLVWEKNAGRFYNSTWKNAMFDVASINTGNRNGWRIPTIQELGSLRDFTLPNDSNFRFPSGIFNNLHPRDPYFSSTTSQKDITKFMSFDIGSLIHITKDGGAAYLWAVRGSVK